MQESQYENSAMKPLIHQLNVVPTWETLLELNLVVASLAFIINLQLQAKCLKVGK